MSKTNSKEELFEKLLETENKIDNMHNGGSTALKVELLHKYNDIKDATQVVISHIANLKGTTVTEVHKQLKLTDLK